MVRATIRDAKGRVVTTADHLISFTVESGPGLIAGVHNGDAKSHEPQIATVRHAYHGLARAVVKVTEDAASASQADLALLATQIELNRSNEAAGKIAIDYLAGSTSSDAYTSIVVTATCSGLAMGSITIPVSTNSSADSVLAVAAASTQLELTFD